MCQAVYYCFSVFRQSRCAGTVFLSSPRFVLMYLRTTQPHLISLALNFLMPSPITSIESSTPSGIKTTASTNSVHSFFTPRRAFNSAGSRAGPSRVRLLAAEESPSQRSAKRPRVNSCAPVPSSGLATIQKLDNRDSEQKLEPEPQWTYPKPRQRRSGTTQYGLLMRSLNGSNAFSAPGRTSVRGFHFVGGIKTFTKYTDALM
jgi:hypothetical protein